MHSNGELEESFLLQATQDAELERRVLEALLEICEATLAQRSAPGSSNGSYSGDEGSIAAIRRHLATEFVAERADVLEKLIDTLRAQMPRARAPPAAMSL